MLFDLTNETMCRYHDVAGTVAEGYFIRYGGAVGRGPLGGILRLDRVASAYGSLAGLLDDVGCVGLAEAGQECATSFALLAALPALNVNVGQSGLTVTSVGSMAPASVARVSSLRDAVRDRAFEALAHLYDGLWEAFPHLAPRAQECLQETPWRALLCRNPYRWVRVGVAAGIGLHHFFTWHGVLQRAEREVAHELLGPPFYDHARRVWLAPGADPLPEPLGLLRDAAYLLAAGRAMDHAPSLEEAARLLAHARGGLEARRDEFPLWAGSPYDTGWDRKALPTHRRDGFFKA